METVILTVKFIYESGLSGSGGFKMGMRVGVVTGGGDVPPLNAIMHGIAEVVEADNGQFVGFMRGWAGVLNSDRGPRYGRYMELKSSEIPFIQGGTVLKSSRTNLAKIDGGFEEAAHNINSLVDGLIAIGGDDTLTVGRQFIGRVNCDFVTKTVDGDFGKNPPPGPLDLEKMVNYFTPGFITAAISGIKIVRDLRTTTYDHDRFMLVESMGRHSGYLALSTCLANPDMIIIPEAPLHLDDFFDRAIGIYQRQGYFVGVVSEGVVLPDGGLLIMGTPEERAKEPERDFRVDEAFGYIKLGGAAQYLASLLEREVRKRGVDAPYFNGLPPGYLYRGGNPTKADAEYGRALGRRAAELMLRGVVGQVAVLKRKGDALAVDNLPMDEVVEVDENGKIKQRLVDERFYDPETYSATEAGRDYFRMLDIQVPGFYVPPTEKIKTL